jgi:hypothetical protein
VKTTAQNSNNDGTKPERRKARNASLKVKENKTRLCRYCNATLPEHPGVGPKPQFCSRLHRFGWHNRRRLDAVRIVYGSRKVSHVTDGKSAVQSRKGDE